MKRSLVLAVVAVLLTNSCAVYHPQTVDIPLIHRKNDFRFDGGLSIGPPSLNTTLSYGLTQRWAVQIYGNIRPEESNHLQGAFGYYKNLRNHKVFEAYAGVGGGRGYTPISSTGESLYNHYGLAFTQLNLGRLSTEDAKLEYGVGLKLGFLRSYLSGSDYYSISADYNSSDFLLEPTVFLRPGGKNVKVNFKLSGSWVSSFAYGSPPFPYSKLNFGIGLNIR